MTRSGDLIVSVDGELMPLAEARISPLDHAVTVGDGVFETLLVVRSTPFAWRRHHERLAHSAAGLSIDVPDGAALRAHADALISATNMVEGRLRITLTAGEGPPGSGAPTGPAVVFMVATPIERPAPTASVVVAPWTRNENDACAGLKTVSYAGNVRALGFAAGRGADEAIFENTAGNVCEATGSNVFAVMADRLVTPPLSAGCLAGVTRALILELTPAIGVVAEERDITVDELKAADEAFLSSTTRMVQPIATFDGVAMKSVGSDISTRLARAFAELMANDLDP